MNMQKQSEEKEIRLADLFEKIVYGWRFILAGAIIFAILLSGFRYWRDSKTISANKNQADISLEQMKEDLSEEEVEAIDLAQELQKKIEEREKYQTESVWLNLDAYAVNVAVLQYYVDTDYVVNLDTDIQSDYSQDLIRAYISHVENKGIQNQLKEQMDWDVEGVYINELLSVVSAADGKQFTLTAAGKDEAQAKQLADEAAKLLEAYQPVLEEKIGSHKLVLLDDATAVINNSVLAKVQTDISTEITDLKTKLETLIAGFTPTQNQVYQEELVAEPMAQDAPHFSVRYFVLGAVIGIFIACVWLALCVVLSNKVKNLWELQEYYGISLLGRIQGGKSKKRFLSVVDCWIDKLLRKETLILEEQKEMILTKLQLRCKKDGIQKVFFTAPVHLAEDECALVDEIRKDLENTGIRAVFGEDILHNAESFEKMSEIGQLVLLEKAGVSSYACIEQELILCEEQKANVLGAVWVE